MRHSTLTEEIVRNVIPERFNPPVRHRVGDEAVSHYCHVKSELTRFGNWAQQVLADLVDGSIAGGGNADIETAVGVFEVRASHNTKPSKGVRGDLELLKSSGRAGWIVQVLGEVPKNDRGVIDTRTFLRMHGVDEDAFATRLEDEYPV